MKTLKTQIDRAIKGKKPLKNKWHAYLMEDRKEIYVFHYQHLIHVFNYRINKTVFRWYETRTDKRGFNFSHNYLNEMYNIEELIEA